VSARACEVCGSELAASEQEGLLVCPRCNDLHVSEDALAVSLSDEGERTAQLPGRIVFTREMKQRFFMSRVIGRGGMGIVVEAGDRKLGRPVAIKFLTRLDDDNALQRFLLEGRMLTEMRHPNVLQVFEAGAMDAHPYLVCELLDGGTLRDRLDRERRLGPRVAVPLAVGCLAGIAALHERGIIHRDLKPQNILFDRAGRPKIADLGLAKDYGGGANLTVTGTLLGTPKYMSPEQCRGEKVTPAADLYSMGVVLYEMLAGKPPFAEDALFMMITRHMEDPPPPLREAVPDVPPALADVVHAALAKRPEERPPGALELSNLLKRSIDAKVKREPAPAPAAPEAKADSRPLVLAGAVTIVALLALSVGLAQRPTRWGPPPPSPTARVRPVKATELAVSTPVLVTPSVPAAVREPPAPPSVPQPPPPVATVVPRASARPPPPPTPAGPWLEPTSVPRALWRIAPEPYQHPGPLAAVAFHSGQLVSAGTDGTLCWWNSATGERVRTFKVDGGRVTAAALAAFRPVLACAHEDGVLSVWDCTTDSPIRIREHPVAAVEVTVSAAGDGVAALSVDGEVWVLGEGAKPVKLGGRGFTGVRFTRSGRELVTRETAPAVKVWNARTGALVRLFAVDVPADARLLTASDDAVYLSAGGVLAGFTLTGNRVALGAAPAALAAGVSADGRQVIAASDDALVRFDAASGISSDVPGGGLAGVRHVSVSEDGRLFAAAAADGVMRAGDAARGLAGRDDPLGLRAGVALSSDGRTLALAGSRRVAIADVARRKALAREPAHGVAAGVAVGAANAWLAVAGVSGLTMRQDGQAAHTPLAGLMLAAAPSCLGASADGALALGCPDGRALVFPRAGASPIALREPAGQGVLAIGPGALGRTCAVASGPAGALRLYDLAAAPRVARELATGRLVTHAAIAPDGARALTAAGYETVTWWRIADGARLAHWSVALAPEAALFTAGPIAAWSDAAGAVHVERENSAPLDLPGGAPVVHLSGSADGRVLAALGADGSLTVWQVP
jgi:serine/threonine protein kinase